MRYRIYKSHDLVGGEDAIEELGTANTPSEVKDIVDNWLKNVKPYYYIRIAYNKCENIFGIDYGSHSEFIIIKCENNDAYAEYCDYLRLCNKCN